MGRWKKPPAAGSEKPPAAGSEKPSSCGKVKSPFQLVTLEKSYAESSFPSESTQWELSAKLGLTYPQLKDCFCRRRLKDRQTKVLIPSSETEMEDRQETDPHDAGQEETDPNAADYEKDGNEEADHQGEEFKEQIYRGKRKPELSSGSKCNPPTVAVDVVNRNTDIEKQLNQLLSVVKEQQSDLPKLVKRCSTPAVELKTKVAELEKLVATLKQQQAEEKKTAKQWKGAFEEEKALREKVEKELREERSAWAVLVLQLEKAKKQNEDMFNTASERFGKMRRVSGLSKDSSSSPPAASSG